ncbi:divergent paired-related homeobox-like [Ictidomys tridecemlineatus]|nr:divergent paired-related homeobox-like [Ictidomys tridecemlineatus]
MPRPDPEERNSLENELGLKGPAGLVQEPQRKLKKEKQHVQQKQETPSRRKSSRRKSRRKPRRVSAPREPEPSPCPVAPVYTNCQTPSFQLSICPPFKVHTVHARSHKMIHLVAAGSPPCTCSGQFQNLHSAFRAAQWLTATPLCQAERPREVAICEALGTRGAVPQ